MLNLFRSSLNLRLRNLFSFLIKSTFAAIENTILIVEKSIVYCTDFQHFKTQTGKQN